MRNRTRSGQVLVVFAVAAVALFAITALAIDGGRVLMDQRALQNAVDGAALSGAADIGPGASSSEASSAEDDTVYAIEQSLNIDFSNNYTGFSHRLVGGGCNGVGCNPPYANPTISWVDQSGAYTLTVTSPYVYGSKPPEAVIHVDLVHQLPLLIGGSLFPTLAVHVQSTAENYAVPYAIFTFKHNDPKALTTQGSVTMTASKRVGTNGTATLHANSLTFNCVSPPTPARYGGDLWQTYTPGGQTGITATSIAEGSCPAGPVSDYKTLSSYVFVPNLHLPPDPSTTTQGAITVSGTVMLTPTRSSDPTRPFGPRYTTINVNNGGILVLQPGVYFFEGTSALSGLIISSGGIVETGDCYTSGQSSLVLPCWQKGAASRPPVCPSGLLGVVLTLAGGGSDNFHCTADDDFGVLLVFWPYSTLGDSVTPCTNANPIGSPRYYCTEVTGGGGIPGSGGDNQLNVKGGGNIYLTSSEKYHNVAIFVDRNNGNSSWNFTDALSLSTAGCTTITCANHIGTGSHVVNINGGGSISINGAVFAPNDNLFLGGGTSGSGYGQLLGYTLQPVGNSTVRETYNPIALAYSPVLVQ